MPRRILLPFDGSAGSRAALPHALHVADRFDAPLDAVYVVDVGRKRRGADPGSLAWEGNRALDEVIDAGAERAVDVEPTLLEGIPHERILDHSRERDAALVVMGTRGPSGVERVVLGSVTERVVRRSRVGVLTVGGTDADPPAPPYEAVVVALDDTPASWAALDRAVELAADDATVHLLHAVETGAFGPDVQSRVVLADLTDAGDDLVAAAADRAADAGAERTVTAVREGPAHEVVQDYVESVTADLVALGTHGRTGVRRHLLGSTTGRVLRSTPAPVLCVPAPD